MKKKNLFARLEILKLIGLSGAFGLTNSEIYCDYCSKNICRMSNIAHITSRLYRNNLVRREVEFEHPLEYRYYITKKGLVRLKYFKNDISEPETPQDYANDIGKDITDMVFKMSGGIFSD